MYDPEGKRVIDEDVNEELAQVARRRKTIVKEVNETLYTSLRGDGGLAADDVPQEALMSSKSNFRRLAYEVHCTRLLNDGQERRLVYHLHTFASRTFAGAIF
jgi:hypothetical protein